MAEKTLEEFISEYIKNKELSSTKESYEAWLRKNGISAESTYGNSIKEIDSDYKRMLPTHGSDAEKLSDIGLTDSGYSDYLRGKAYSQMQRDKSIARSKYASDSTKNIKGYQSYLDSYAKSESAAIDKVVRMISSDGILDYDTAYRYAVTLGLSKESAAAAAGMARDHTIKTLKSSLMNRIISGRLTGTQARELALGLGFDKKDADSLEKYAEEVNSYYPSKKK